jgi:3-dehydroquinate synthetase
LGAKPVWISKSIRTLWVPFIPADTLMIWPGALETLSQKEYVSGLAESLKAALLKDSELWDASLKTRLMKSWTESQWS